MVRFTNLYKSIDNDQDGVISEIQFKDLMRLMRVLETDEEIEQLLHKTDPFNHQKMTYSDVVSVLSTQMVLKDPSDLTSRTKVAIMEKFISETEGQDEEDYRPNEIGESLQHEINEA